EWRPASGLLSVRVAAPLPDLTTDAEVEIFGRLRRPDPPANLGSFDYPAHLAARRIHAVLTVEAADAVQVRSEAPAWSPAAARDRLRAAAQEELHRLLPPRVAPLSEALLLGCGAALGGDELADYLQSGTIHLLVVSGSHLVMAAAAAWMLAVAVGLSRRRRAVAVVGAVAGYAYFTGAESPAVRAAITLGAFAAADLVGRSAQPLNSLCGAFLVVAFADPAEPFRTGAQLSFLAALTLLLFCRRQPVVTDPLDDLPVDDPWGLRWAAGGLARLVREALWVSLAVWLLSAPLLLSTFHLWSPSGVALSALLLPTVAAAMLVGGALALACWLAPPLAPPLAGVLTLLLDWTAGPVQWVDGLFGAYAYSAAPPLWWVAGFYAGLLLPWFHPRFTAPTLPYAGALCGWCAVGGVALTVTPAGPGRFEFHQLAVGHGLATVLRTPAGETLLYDAGSLSTSKVGARVVAPWLWAMGIRRIDAVVLSHADADHYNGLSELVDRFSVGTVLTPPQTVAPRDAGGRRMPPDPAVASLFRRCVERGADVRLVWEGDVVRLGGADGWTLRVLHPPADFPGPTDNANSLVLDAHGGSRRVVLTGDLEKSGLSRLLSLDADGPVDVFAAPHHGSRTSNMATTAAWTPMGLVAASRGPDGSPTAEDHLAVYQRAGAATERTDRGGTISAHWTVGGRVVEVERFLGGSFFLPPR
ncbi:MAG: ComEC/Rec2 family competence protein, partial [Planctomycetia bacterium]